jgi:MFS family permease
MISLERYRQFFSVPGMGSTMLASVVGRLPIGVTGLAILLFVQGKSGSFAQAGTAGAFYVIGLAAVAPLLGRLIDRSGPRQVLMACSMAYPAALLGLVMLVLHAAHPAWVAACALVAGSVLPPVTICMRALYPRVLSDVTLLQTAYSVDSALVETVFIVGPALVALFVAADHPAGAVMLAAVCAAVGGVIFLRSPAIRGWARSQAGGRRPRLALQRYPRLLAVFAATVMYSVAFGLFEVAVTAFAAQQGAPAAAGIALALASAGSAAGALVYGSRHWSPPLPRQFLTGLGLMAAGTLLLAAVGNIYLFALASIVAGAPMAPVIAAQSLLVSRLAPREMLAEAFTWGSTCLLGGIGIGIAAGGLLAEFAAPSLILLASAGATACAGVIVWLALPDDTAGAG